MAPTGDAASVLTYSSGIITVNSAVSGKFNLGFYFQLANFTEIATNINYLFVNVSSPPYQTPPFYALSPNPTYTLSAGSSLDLNFDI
jgi:hypothetical protein